VEIRRRRWALERECDMKRVLIGVTVVAVLAGAVYLVLNHYGLIATAATATPEPQVDPEPVKASTAVVADAILVPSHDVMLGLPAGGIVVEIGAGEGDSVGAGQMLLRIGAARQEAAVAQAQAQLLRAQNAVLELKAGARAEEIETARAAVEAAEAQLVRVRQGALPEGIEAAKAALDGAQASLRRVKEGPTDEELVAARADLANAEAAVRQAQSAYDLVKWAPQV
jgi:HlyD family secretion protein